MRFPSQLLVFIAVSGACHGKFKWGNICFVIQMTANWVSGILENNWHELNLDSGSMHRRMFFLKYMIFIVEEETGVTKAMDMTTRTLVYVIPPTEGYSIKDSCYMVMVESFGDILRVIRRFDPYVLGSEWFDVYQLDANKSGSPCWVKVTSICDQALFIDWCGALTLRANDFARIKRNSIYFYLLSGEEYEVKRMDIETGAVAHLQTVFCRPGNWFVPNLHRL